MRTNQHTKSIKYYRYKNDVIDVRDIRDEWEIAGKRKAPFL